MAFRVGFGTDLHLLIPGDGLFLGGAKVPCAHRTKAHSDGDVLLHAVIDALLGACAMGDIGEHFPASQVQEGERSTILLAKTLEMLAPTGINIINVDCVIDLEVVRLSGWKGEIRATLAGLLGIGEGRVGVKAKTAEGVGPVGEGRAVSAQAVLLAEFPE